jgi:integrase
VVASTEQLAGKGNCREKETKGTRNRTIALSAQVAHKLRQAEELLRLGSPQRDSHVVAKEDGTPIQPRSLTHEWVRLLGVHALKRIKLHSTRHSHAMPNMQQDAVELVDDALQSCASKAGKKDIG